MNTTRSRRTQAQYTPRQPLFEVRAIEHDCSVMCAHADEGIDAYDYADIVPNPNVAETLAGFNIEADAMMRMLGGEP